MNSIPWGIFSWISLLVDAVDPFCPITAISGIGIIAYDREYFWIE
jgi:hypothetical protein